MNPINKIFHLLSNREKFLACFILILSILNMILDIFSIGILIPLFANLTDQIKVDNYFFNLIFNFL